MTPDAVEPVVSEMNIALVQPGDVDYERAISLTRVEYARHFRCDLRHFYPKIFCLYHDDLIVACAGFKPAAEGTLYLEQYLQSSIETVLAEKLANSTGRGQIVEIGGFAVSNPAYAMPFMARLASEFARLNYTTAVCTVTSPVRCYLRKLRVDTVCLGRADSGKVDLSDNAWGTYYDLKPSVLAGDINATMEKFFPKDCSAIMQGALA